MVDRMRRAWAALWERVGLFWEAVEHRAALDRIRAARQEQAQRARRQEQAALDRRIREMVDRQVGEEWSRVWARTVAQGKTKAAADKPN